MVAGGEFGRNQSDSLSWTGGARMRVVYRHTGSGCQRLVESPGYSGCTGPWIDQPLPSGRRKAETATGVVLDLGHFNITIA
jgi:hypothetical protein